MLARLMHERGVKMLRTSPAQRRGNMDFYNMLERERLESKKISKTNAVTSIMATRCRRGRLHRSLDYVVADRPQVGAPSARGPGLRRRAAQHGDEARGLDSPNSAGIVIDAVRCCKLALNHGIGGQLDGPSSYLMKSPHNQRPTPTRASSLRSSSPSTRAEAARHAAQGPHRAQALDDEGVARHHDVRMVTTTRSYVTKERPV